MTENRRITDKLPGQPLQWDDEAASAAPAAGQAGLATNIVREAVEAAFEEHVGWRAKIAAAVRALAAPADAGAGLTDERIDEIAREKWVLDGRDTEGFAYIPFARAIEREVLARLSTPGAPVTASHPSQIATTDAARGFLVKWMKAHFPTDKTFGDYIEFGLTGDFAFQLAKALEAAPAPVAAEPARSIDTLEFRKLLWEFHDIPNGSGFQNSAFDALVAHINSKLPAPADRDAIRDQALEEAAEACEGSICACCWPEGTQDAAAHAAVEIRALKSMERAADAAETRDAKGGE